MEGKLELRGGAAHEDHGLVKLSLTSKTTFTKLFKGSEENDLAILSV